MIDFDAVLNKTPLEALTIAAGNNEKFRVRFNYIFEPGVVLVSATTSITSPSSTVTQPAFADDRMSLTYVVQTTMLVENFTVGLTVVTNDGQMLAFTIIYEVTGPFVSSSVPNPKPLIIGPTGATGPAGSGGSGSSGLYAALLAGGT